MRPKNSEYMPKRKPKKLYDRAKNHGYYLLEHDFKTAMRWQVMKQIRFNAGVCEVIHSMCLTGKEKGIKDVVCFARQMPPPYSQTQNPPPNVKLLRLSVTELLMPCHPLTHNSTPEILVFSYPPSSLTAEELDAWAIAIVLG
jgi:hypothetical protein